MARTQPAGFATIDGREHQTLGDRSKEIDPRAVRGTSEPVNILGEYRKVRDPNRPGDWVPNQGPDRYEFGTPEERLAYAQSQLAVGNQNRVIGENHLSGNFGATPGAGLPDSQPTSEEVAAQIRQDRKRAQERIEHAMIAYEQFVSSIHLMLSEARALDLEYFDAHYAHLRKVNLPLAKNPDISSYSTFEKHLSGLHQSHPQFDKSKDRFNRRWGTSPEHPDYVEPTEEQKLKQYGYGGPGGYVGMTRDIALWLGLDWAEVMRVNKKHDQQELDAFEAGRAPHLSNRPTRDEMSRYSR